MTNLVVIFACGFFSVFMMGFQSRNVNHGNYKWAAMSSFGIGVSSLYLWKNLYVGGLLEGIIYGASGALAITSSMYIHERFVKRGGKS